MAVPDARELADGPLVREAGNVALLKPESEAPVELRLRVPVALRVTRGLPDVDEPHRIAEVLKLLAEEIADAHGVDVHGLEPAAVGRQGGCDVAARV